RFRGRLDCDAVWDITPSKVPLIGPRFGLLGRLRVRLRERSLKGFQCPPLRRQPDVGIVVEHLPAHVAGDAHDGLVALAAFAKLRDRLVSEIVEAKPLQTRRLRQAPPGGPPALHGSRWVEMPLLTSGKYK